MANMMRWEPGRDLMGMRDAMDRIFDDFFTRNQVGYEGYGIVDIDMLQTDNDVVVKASIPGVSPDNINISVTGDTLTLRGEVDEDQEYKGANYHIRERKYGAFARSILLPSQVVADRAKAEFENGVLKLTLPKADEVKPKTITVKAK